MREKQQKGLVSPDDYLESRPIIAEAEAVDRAIAYAKLTGCALHFVHISSEAAIKNIEAAKLAGIDVTVETCPHYLLFSHQDLVEKGAIAKCSPPLREKKEQERLIQLLIEGKFDMISSDHSPCPYSMKDPSVYNLFEAWGGISGGQFTLLSMIELAIIHNIPFTRVAEWTSAAPAKRFHLRSKGSIQVGMDADLAIVSMENLTITEDNFYAKHKQSLYLGHTFPCQVTATYNRGKLIFDNGDIIESGSVGKWLHENNIR
jgi:allantoinase